MSAEYILDDTGRFIINNYQNKKTFASFLPGIAGKLGIPIWAFYVNRGQAIASFGSENKDSSIMEFYPANKSYENTPTKGFRTFYKLKQEDQATVYEPFRNLGSGITSEMTIAPHALTIAEENLNLGLKTTVKYFILPNENFGALIRRLSVKNLSPDRQELELLDGMPVLVPYGIEHGALKEVSQTISAWAKVYGFQDKTPFYRLRASAADEAEVKKMNTGNFYFSFTQTGAGSKLLTPLVDRDVIFAEVTSLEEPAGFKRNELADYQGEQILENRFPAAMAAARLSLAPAEEIEVASVFGRLADQTRLAGVKDTVLAEGYLDRKEAEAESIHAFYADNIFTASGRPQLDAYSRQTFLDNMLRGGFPINLGGKGAETTYHIFSRKHGDLERDYNDFLLEPTYYSQGNGNYRDVNQNRRSDLYFNPDVRDDNIKLFANLIQADGYNPLVIAGKKFILAGEQAGANISVQVEEADRDVLLERLEQPFTPGELANFIEDHGLKLSGDLSDFIDLVIANSRSWTEAHFGEGFWIDHWTYLLDLIENYLAVYPERDQKLLFEDDSYTYYDNYVKVLPRKQKHVLTATGPRQYGALQEDEAKKAEIAGREEFPYYLRTAEGEVYSTTLAVKLLTLVVTKVSTLDPAGVGVEMEANKPGWYDALNGLPGIFGSSTGETMELLRLVEFLEQKFQAAPGDNELLALPEEVYQFYREMDEILQEWEQDGDNFAYWQQASTARESYRDRVFSSLIGKEENLSTARIQEFLSRIEDKLRAAVNLAREDSGLFTMYFSYEAVEYEETGELSPQELPLVKITEFKQERLPAFLEGQVRAMKILPDRTEAAGLHQTVKSSGLYDEPLQMYRVNADLSEQSYEIGRARAFSPGWLENGSIWLHMEYKYFLELLKSGLYREYYQAIEAALVPFQDPVRYGRSILENSSFILSSLNGDSANHGRGYIARLSGSTAEYLQMWSLMAFGPEPFKLEGKELIYAPEPALKADLFTRQSRQVNMQVSEQDAVEVEVPENAFAHRFLGEILVVYHNPARRDTFGPDKAAISSYRLTTATGEEIEVEGARVKGELARSIREREMKRIDIFLA
ncbi:MAG: BRCT domain-containing protein [Bacillota bacterium]